MFYSKHYTFDFFREKIRFFFVDFFLSGKKNCFFCEKNLGEKKSENFSAKKKSFFFRTKIKSIYFGVKHIQRRAPNSVWARRTISLKLLIILMDMDWRYPFKGGPRSIISIEKWIYIFWKSEIWHTFSFGNGKPKLSESVTYWFYCTNIPKNNCFVVFSHR